ncbi:mediator of RNA polymerase II transcription subunit 32-like [Curcuma longa]|uniref:mediator of RNA polymerase II transcription subunit 32-like n=1 Tax=Curcuma longa TaxID=136217 RepID=UPI003D9EB502
MDEARHTCVMDSAIEAMSSEYEELVAAAVEVVEKSSGGRPGRALEELKQRWQLFVAACDEAEEVVELARRRITADHVIDVASGMAPGGSAAPPLPSISVPHLERAVHAVNSLAADLRQGSPPAAHKVD